MTLAPTTGAANDKTGNGRYTPLKRRKKEDKKGLCEQMDILDKKDIRMRFKNSRDPVLIAFEYLDNQSLKRLAIDFVKESISEIMVFVSKFN